ncbi:N-6 DNA methylase [Ralstonia syzygii]|uniref:site-specific DNA-methyltransferase (adenine-specific) n=1 Tax=Ralstonia syzygii TaxID=28097 RepID=A0ABX7Z9S6_9RALS|nr:class I SAM-dependent DNA methyltransferase [Ralstonia syzygii]QUP52282.1 N-6 DNA methylase [Ralstonia syzygii]
MMTADLQRQVDRIWDAFCTEGIADPVEIIEQLTCLLCLKRLDDLHALALHLARRCGQPAASGTRLPFREDQDDLRWSVFRTLNPQAMFDVMSTRGIPFLRTLGDNDPAGGRHMRDIRFTVPTPALLARVVQLLDAIPLHRRDIKGAVYESLLGRIALAAQGGPFHTPCHIVRFMVELTRPDPSDTLCDPAAGTCGFLAAAGEYLRREHPGLLHDARQSAHFHHGMFHGYEIDRAMLRIGSMNLLLHGVEDADLRDCDALAARHADEAGAYSLILTHPPFTGDVDHGSADPDLLRLVRTRKAELLFLARCLHLLRPGGRAAVIVPDGVLFGSGIARGTLRRMLVEDHQLEGVIKLPGGVFRPYAGIGTAILLFTRTDTGGTGHVWFYDLRADGFSLDDLRTPLLPEDRLGATPATPPAPQDHARNNLPDALHRWNRREAGERGNPRTAQSFCVPKDDIAAQGYDLTLNRYQERMPCPSPTAA